MRLVRRGCNLAVKLEQSVEAISAPSQVVGQIGSSMDERPMNMDAEKRCSFLVESGEAAESGNLKLCHVANGGLSSKAVNVTCGETFHSRDVVCVRGALDKETERSEYEWGSLAGKGGDWGGMADVTTSKCDLNTVSEEAQCDNEGLLDSIKHGTRRWPRAVDGVIFRADDNYGLQQDDSMPKRETKVSGRLHESSDQVAEISGDPLTCHVAYGGLWSKVLCAPFGGGSQSKYSGCVYDMVDKAPNPGQCEEAGLAGEGVVLCDRTLLKTSLEDLPYCYNEVFSNSEKFDIKQLPHDMDAMLLKKDVNHELENDCLLPKTEAKVSSPAQENSVPSTFGSNLAVSLDGKAGEIGEISERKTRMEKVACCLLGVGGLSGHSEFLKEEALGDEIKLSRMEGCHENRGLGHQDPSGVELGYRNHLALELNACNSVVDKPCSVVFVEKGNDEELENQKSESLSVSRRRNPRRSASARNPTLEKHDQIYNGSCSTRKSKKVESSCSLVESTMIKFPNKTTKVRSGINRPVKSTGWGSVQKLAGGFGQNCEPSTSNSHPISLENGRSHKRYGKKEQPSIRKTRSSRCSKNKFRPFSAMGFASDELNGQPIFSVTTGTYASSEGYVGNFARLDPHALVNGSNDAHKTARTDLQQLDRCMDSVTQETCPAYICGDFAKSTSKPSLNIASVGFSPDSVLEVASATCENNTSAIQDAKLCRNPSYPAALTENDLHASALSISDSGKNHTSPSTDLEQRAQTVRGDGNTIKEEINLSPAILGYIGEGKVQILEKSNATRKSKKAGRQERQKKDGMKGKNIKSRGSTKIPSKLGAFSEDSYSHVPSVPPKFGSCFDVVISATQGISMHEHGSMQGPVIGKEKTSALDNVKSPRQKKNYDSGGKKDTVGDPYVKGKSMNKNIAGGIFFDSASSTSPFQLITDPSASHSSEQSNRSPATDFSFKKSADISTGIPRNSACITDGAFVPQPPRAAWVCCDDCQKWRCIPADLADTIGKTNCRWTCKNNQDKTIADCSIPQEKTNAEINAELDLSDASADEADNDGSNSKASKAPSWTHARTNSFLHRNRRNQSVDESMVCNCKPPQDGRMGCRDGCLNRMLNIECEKRTCPCGEQCSNQQFQRRSYAKISWFHSGKKGYGLQLHEEVSEGRFLIEYVGEVLDITAYESRQRYYASKSQKHFYFMALNGGEVIDACTKGNLGRFINHSCSPNCRTEKWMVNGEVCIGIFAMRNIKKGEELTFDYNYVRVSGAAPQKCFCGTAKCRGYIGGDISVSDIIAQDDVEAEHLEPMITYKDAEEMLGNAYFSHGTNPNIVGHDTSIQREDLNNCAPATPDSEPHQQTLSILPDTSDPDNSMEAWSPQDAEDIIRTPVHVSRTIESSLQQFPVYGTQPLEFLEKTPVTIDDLTAPNVMNRSTPSSGFNASLVHGFNAKKKNSLKHHRNVKPPCSIDNEHTLGVEGRLNSLLDKDGGISMRKGISMHEHGSMQGPVIGKEKTSALDNVKSPRQKKNYDSGGKKDTVGDPYVKGKSMNKNIAGGIFFDSASSTSPFQLITDPSASHSSEQSNRSPATDFSFKKSADISTGIPRNSACITDGAFVPQPPRAAWVCCDDCQKWRCIPADLADTIGKTNCRWTCKNNQDKTIADCSIPQEKTNAEINAELDLSDASADEADNDGSNSKASKAPSWTHARTNSFLHRNRRNQSVDESMVCNCKPPQDGRMGCRDGCLNRMLNIECEKRTCPCGEQCSNQQFQRRSYAKISWFHSGKKGYGLQLHEEVSEGRFLIEYVGEVLDITAYESRQRYYASKSQKHFYFMALNGGEVIDACTKGNLGRFINHSCSPNCRTEKWMVNGEVCIGIFAMRNIKKGEELTFDYNYVRVSGAAPQKCFCGTAKCRGYIGGDISVSDIIAQDDVEAEHLEPMITYKDAEEMLGNAYFSHGTNPNIVGHDTSIQREDLNNCAPATPDSEPHQQTLSILPDTSDPDNSMEAWSPQDAEDIIRTPVHVSRTIESSLQQFPVYGTQPLEFLEKTPVTIDDLTAPNVMNRSTPSSGFNASLVHGFNAKKKNSLKHHRNVKPPCSIDNEHTLGVEGRLNSLLDKDGGISMRKDSTHEYLKLLIMTAADGDDAVRTSKSIRDLALILEALLQTKSGAVLLDIINTNGLQMLHNILKQNRDHFIRRPIIRKLLKVLEFLALRGILTAEKINEGHPLEGMESFRDSMLKLTRHSDKHVHLIARKFCDQWILSYMDGPANCSTRSYSSRRKRKSRWDYQPESHYKMVKLQTERVYSGHGKLDLPTSLIKKRSHANRVTNSNHNDVPVMGSSTDVADDDVPPGFEPQQERQPAQASLDCGVAPGFCQETYLPNLSISYGIPIALVQHFGTPEVEGTQSRQKWRVAPGVPFNPFPPLPTYPLGSPCSSTSLTQMSRHDGASAMKHNSSGYRGRGTNRGGRVHRSWRNGARTRFPYDHQGRRFPSNHHRL